MGWIPNVSSVTDDDAIHDNVAGEISALSLVSAASGDHLLIEDASDSDNKKRVTAADFLAGGATSVTLIEEKVVSTDVTHVEFTGIASSYDDLLIEYELQSDYGSGRSSIELNVGNTSIDTGSNYRWVSFGVGGSSTGDTKIIMCRGRIPQESLGWPRALGTMKIIDYAAQDSRDRYFFGKGITFDSNGIAGQDWGMWVDSSSVIDVVRLSSDVANLSAGRVRLFGLSR